MAVLNRQRRITIDVQKVRAVIGGLRKVFPGTAGTFNVAFVTNAEMTRLNRTFRGNPYPTDVLSFPRELNNQGRDRGNVGRFWGDIVIAAAVAKQNARSEGHSTQREISWLILHGALHLLGYDHEKDNGEMTARELQLRTELGIDDEEDRGLKGKRRKTARRKVSKKS